ncbi:MULTISPECIES: flagellin [unclassified Clostridium]|uniref:flagellin n=1 Tax=unclassified Clostridium TaxID=2614128 RepID=UPI000297D6CA|nr:MULTISPECIES: flagellin [unclassified Clostridium]EKQ51095.1 MAG: flagellin/flagellar hook associated protein [Clostridium sp. Maddingley MBC34-26]
MRLNHNMISMRIYQTYKNTLSEASQALNNISTGKKVGSAKDNPNKIAEVENLDLQIKASDAASQNIQDTNSMLQTYDGALQEVNNNLSRLKQLTVQAATGTYDSGELAVIQKEVDGVKKTIKDLCENTSFNGKKLSSSTPTPPGDISNPDKSLAAIGILPNEKTYIPFYNLESAMNINGIDVTVNSQAAIQSVDDATVNIAKIRSRYGAIQSRLEDTYATSNEISEVYSRAQSNVEDADIAEEMLTYSKTQILYKTSIGLMAQSNKLPQNSLNVLANVR